MGLVNYKRVHAVGRGTGKTRAQSAISSIADKLTRCRHRYTAARTALLALDDNPNSPWRSRLLEMKSTDLKTPQGLDPDDSEDDERRTALGEGPRETPWIWTGVAPDVADVPSSNVTSEDVVAGACISVVPPQSYSTAILIFQILTTEMRFTYSRAHARWQCWCEEVDLLLEEMRRVLKYFLWKAEKWRSRTTARSDAPADLRSGLVAHAFRQAEVYGGLAKRFAAKWIPRVAEAKLPVAWPPELVLYVGRLNISSQASFMGRNGPETNVAPPPRTIDTCAHPDVRTFH